MRLRLFPTMLLVCAACGAQAPTRQRPAYPHPGFKPTPPQTAMPKSTLVVQETRIEKARFPALDIHFHGRFLRTPADYQKLISIMDQVGVGMLVNPDGGSGKEFDEGLKSGEPYRNRVMTFARLNWDGVNEPGWTQKMVAELERCFRVGAPGRRG